MTTGHTNSNTEHALCSIPSHMVTVCVKFV